MSESRATPRIDLRLLRGRKVTIEVDDPASALGSRLAGREREFAAAIVSSRRRQTRPLPSRPMGGRTFAYTGYAPEGAGHAIELRGSGLSIADERQSPVASRLVIPDRGEFKQRLRVSAVALGAQ